MRWNNLLVTILAAITVSCIDRFIPETAGYDEVLFIECLISDDSTQPQQVNLSRTAPVSTIRGDKIIVQPKPVGGAKAWITSGSGQLFPCTESGAGTYSLPSGFAALPGQSYRLTVEADGEVYESESTSLIDATPIDSISCKHVVEKISEDGEVVDGLRFFASTHGPADQPVYYRWTADATYTYTVPYLASHIWDGRTTTPASNKLIRTCWKSKTITGVFLATTAGLADHRIVEAPLNFESADGDELSIRYSLNVRQFTISPAAYKFWDQVRKLVYQTGGLYEIQPARIQGNIRCVSDTSRYVAGIFEVSGVSTLRTFVDQPTEFQINPPECLLMRVGEDIPWWRLPAGSYVTIDIVSGDFMTATPSCYDCRLRDGTLEKPPFWTDR